MEKEKAKQTYYKVDTTRYATEGKVFIINANSRTGKSLPGIIYTKKNAKKAARDFLDAQKPDESLIQYMSKDVFLEMIKHLDYKSIIRLCNISNLYKRFCNDKGVWKFLLKRDFSPLLKEDYDNYEINPKELYYRIQREDIKPVRVLYKEYKDEALYELSNDQRENYYGTLWLLNVKHIDPSDENNDAIRRASENGHVEVVKLLLADKRIDPSDQDNQAIIYASENGHVEIVKLLLNEVPRVDPSDDDNLAIRFASRYGHVEVVKLLLTDDRVDPSDLDNYAIKWASSNGHIEVVRLLLTDDRVDPSDDDNDAIISASRYGHVEVVRLLMNVPRIDPSDQDNLAIQRASSIGYKDIVRLLLTDARVIESLSAEELARIERRL